MHVYTILVIIHFYASMMQMFLFCLLGLLFTSWLSVYSGESLKLGWVYVPLRRAKIGIEYLCKI